MHLDHKNFRIFYAFIGAMFYSLIFFKTNARDVRAEFELFFYNFSFFAAILYFTWNKASDSFSKLYHIQEKAKESTYKSKFAGFELTLDHGHDLKEQTIADIKQGRRTLGFIFTSALLFMIHAFLQLYIFGLGNTIGVGSRVSSMTLVFIYASFRFWGAHLLGLYIGLILYAASMKGDSLIFYFITFLFMSLFLILHTSLTSWYWQKMSAANFNLKVGQVLKKTLIPLVMFFICFTVVDMFLPQRNNLLSLIAKKMLSTTVKSGGHANGVFSNLDIPQMPSVMPQMDMSQIMNAKKAQEMISDLPDQLKFPEEFDLLNHWEKKKEDIEKELEKSGVELKQAENDLNTTEEELQALKEEHEKMYDQAQKLEIEYQHIKNIHHVESTINKKIEKEDETLKKLQELAAKSNAAQSLPSELKRLEEEKKLEKLTLLLEAEMNEKWDEDFILDMIEKQKKYNVENVPITIEDIQQNPELKEIHTQVVNSFKSIDGIGPDGNINADKLKKQFNQYLEKDKELEMAVFNFMDQTLSWSEDESEKYNQVLEQKILQHNEQMKKIQVLTKEEDIIKEIQKVVDEKTEKNAQNSIESFAKSLNIPQKNRPLTAEELKQQKKLEQEISNIDKELVEKEELRKAEFFKKEKALKEKQLAVEKSFKDLSELSNQKYKNERELQQKLTKHQQLKLDLAKAKEKVVKTQKTIEKLKVAQPIAPIAVKQENPQLNPEQMEKAKLFEQFNEKTKQQDLFNCEVLLKEIERKERLGDIKLTNEEREQLDKIKNKINAIKQMKKNRKSSLPDYYAYLKKLFVIVVVFLFAFFLSKLSRKKSFTPDELIDPNMLNELKNDFKNMPNRYNSFSDEVLTRYKFFHKSMGKVFFQNEETPPPLIIPRLVNEDKNLSRAAEIMGQTFNLVVYESQKKFSVKERNQFRASFKYFAKSLKL